MRICRTIFNRPSSGLTTVGVCADSGMLATDACRADSRGPDEPRGGWAQATECTLHKMVVSPRVTAWPVSSARRVHRAEGLSDYVREDYGESITASDDAYLISTLERRWPRRPAPAVSVHVGCSWTDDPNGGWIPAIQLAAA
ncbi:MAG: hypothetical protein ACLTYN_10425 [Dysosmobacter welbionis]